MRPKWSWWVSENKRLRFGPGGHTQISVWTNHNQMNGWRSSWITGLPSVIMCAYDSHPRYLYCSQSLVWRLFHWCEPETKSWRLSVSRESNSSDWKRKNDVSKYENGRRGEIEDIGTFSPGSVLRVLFMISSRRWDRDRGHVVRTTILTITMHL